MSVIRYDDVGVIIMRSELNLMGLNRRMCFLENIGREQFT